MKHLNLSESFLIDHKQIDEEHKDLVKKVNTLIDSFNQKDTKACMQNLVDFQANLITHFKNEESIMIDHNFFEAKQHQIHHEKVLKRTLLWNNQCKTIEDWEKCIIDIFDILLVAILKFDLAFKAHLKRIGYCD